MRARLRTLDGCERVLQVEWPPPLDLRIPIQAPIPAWFGYQPGDSPEAQIPYRVRRYRLRAESIITYERRSGQVEPVAEYFEIWEEPERSSGPLLPAPSSPQAASFGGESERPTAALSVGGADATERTLRKIMKVSP